MLWMLCFFCFLFLSAEFFGICGEVFLQCLFMLLLPINRLSVLLKSPPVVLQCFHNFCPTHWSLLSLCLSFFISAPSGMNGKSILSAMGRHTPEHSSVMSTAGSGATTSPCSSRSSSQRSGTGAHTPGGPHRSPCTQVKTSEGSSSNALTPNAGPARSPVSPKLSSGEFRDAEMRLEEISVSWRWCFS